MILKTLIRRHISKILVASFLLIFADMYITVYWWQYETNAIVTGIGLTNWIHIKIIMAMFLPSIWYIMDQPTTRLENAAYNANIVLLGFIFSFHLLAVVTNLMVIYGYL